MCCVCSRSNLASGRPAARDGEARAAHALIGPTGRARDAREPAGYRSKQVRRAARADRGLRAVSMKYRDLRSIRLLERTLRQCGTVTVVDARVALFRASRQTT